MRQHIIEAEPSKAIYLRIKIYKTKAERVESHYHLLGHTRYDYKIL